MCEDYALDYLREAQAYVNKIEILDTYTSIFEADSEEAKQRIVENEKNTNGAEGTLMKAIKAVKEFIANAIKSIVGFFEKLFASGEQKAEFEKYKELLSRHPEYKNKKVKFYDYKHNHEELEKLAREVELADKKLAAGIDVDTDDLMNKLSNVGKTATGFAATEVSIQTAVNMCYGSKEFAKTLKTAMDHDSRIMEQMEQNLGAKEARKKRKEINKLAKDDFRFFGKRINLRRAMNKARVAECNSAMSAVNYTRKQLKDIFADVGDAMAQTAENDNLRRHGGFKNKAKAKINEVKAGAKLAKMYLKNPEARSIIKSARHHYQNNSDVKDVVDQGLAVKKAVSDKKQKYWDDRREKIKQQDYDTVDYNLRTGKGDYSAQSLFSFLTGADKRRVEKEKRDAVLQAKN